MSHSGFTGSFGNAIVTSKAAFLWTDGRYFLQASQELSEQWTLMKMEEPNVPTIINWLTLPHEDILPNEAKVRETYINKPRSNCSRRCMMHACVCACKMLILTHLVIARSNAYLTIVHLTIVWSGSRSHLHVDGRKVPNQLEKGWTST